MDPVPLGQSRSKDELTKGRREENEGIELGERTCEGRRGQLKERQVPQKRWRG